jgi:hypothetical protein
VGSIGNNAGGADADAPLLLLLPLGPTATGVTAVRDRTVSGRTPGKTAGTTCDRRKSSAVSAVWRAVAAMMRRTDTQLHRKTPLFHEELAIVRRFGKFARLSDGQKVRIFSC